MSGFMQRRPFVNLKRFMSSKISNGNPPDGQDPVNTQAAVDAAQKAHYVAEDAKELKDKHDAVTKTQKKVAATEAEVQAATVVEAQKKVAMNIVQIITQKDRKSVV